MLREGIAMIKWGPDLYHLWCDFTIYGVIFAPTKCLGWADLGLAPDNLHSVTQADGRASFHLGISSLVTRKEEMITNHSLVHNASS